jgi:catechol 2,3-dioxygenase-like lactoylglutathione lyase family enzyme
MDVFGVVPILNVSSLAESFTWFEKLGWRRRWEYGSPPDFGSVGNTQCEIFLCQNGQGSRRGTDPGSPGEGGGTWLCWLLDSPSDVDAIHATALRNGMTVTDPPSDKPWNLREMRLQHPDGHTFRIGAGLGSGEHLIEREPRLPIRRVDVPVRLEARLAAVLTDLAAHKGMSVGECLEETLLHTFERVGTGGVASPHGEGTIDYIQELKEKHGVDYDCHASYRFAETPG